jgi:Tol biopolymer transport system component
MKIGQFLGRAAAGFALLLITWVAGCSTEQDLGMFSKSEDVGVVVHPGEARFDSTREEYEISASGENIWGTWDAFHFLHTAEQGDLTLEASVDFEGEDGDPHRKGGWMIRESLEPDSAYADVMVHGDGLISLQFRRTTGGPTEEVSAPQKAPALIRLERTEDVFSLFVSEDGKSFQPAGGVRLDLPDRVLIGLALCSHQADRTEKAIFSKVSLKTHTLNPDDERILESTLETIEVGTGERNVVYQAKDHFEAPNWSRDSSSLIFKQEGKLYSILLGENEPKLIDTGFADRCNNDHGLSPDGDLLAISHSPEGKSLIYVLPAEGGEPSLVTKLGPSYWHGWSPDGKTLAYCAERNGEYDIYTIPAVGGSETRLTDAPGLDDGPDYSPDGKFIYINSERTGLMKIWRISPDGKAQEQVTFDTDYADWFPHPSPDGRWLVFLSYDKSVEGHPPNKEVVLRVMAMDGGQPKVLTRFFGGQGTINVPSWSPDSKRFAFVSYRLVAP